MGNASVLCSLGCAAGFSEYLDHRCNICNVRFENLSTNHVAFRSTLYISILIESSIQGMTRKFKFPLQAIFSMPRSSDVYEYANVFGLFK